MLSSERQAITESSFLGVYHSLTLTAATHKQQPIKLCGLKLCVMHFNINVLLCMTYPFSLSLTPSDKFVLQSDTSALGITGILSIITKVEELPIGFLSRQLRPAETRYSAVSPS